MKRAKPKIEAGDRKKQTGADGRMGGLYDELTFFKGVPETVAEQLQHIDEWDDPSTYPHLAAGWTVAGDTPFTWTKQVTSNFGGDVL